MATAPQEKVSIATLPAYLRNATPVPLVKRAPWYMNTAPTYAGIFLWFAFYQPLGKGLAFGSLGDVLIGILAAALICHALFYYIPGILGMRTGLPLYVVGTSTFGTKGGYFIPGIFMGLLQIGWYSVATYFATVLIMEGLKPIVELPPFAFYPMAVIWGFIFAMIGALGIQYVARISQFFPVVPILMLLIGAAIGLFYLGDFKPASAPLPGEASQSDWLKLASLLMIQMIVGFFGTAGAVGADFCANNRNTLDVKYAGLTGIALATLFAAGLAVITVAGAHGQNPALLSRPEIVKHADGSVQYEIVLQPPQIKLANGQTIAWESMTKEQRAAVSKARDDRFSYSTALKSLNTSQVQQADGTTKEEPNFLAMSMLLLFAIGSMAPACFCSFIIGNSLSTMLAMPKARIPITLAGAAIGIAIAMTGAPAYLEPIFGLIGASFGPVIGAMIADFYLNGGRWSGPREGVNWAGYGAWLLGFLVGISNNPVVSQLLGFEILAGWHPTGVYSLVVGLIAYVVLARAIGLPPVLEGAVKTIGPVEPAKA